MEVSQDYTVFKCGPPRPQKDLKPQDITILAGPHMKPAPTFFSQRTEKRKSERKTPRCVDHR